MLLNIRSLSDALASALVVWTEGERDRERAGSPFLAKLGLIRLAALVNFLGPVGGDIPN